MTSTPKFKSKRQIKSLFVYFQAIKDPGSPLGKRYKIGTLLSLVAAAVICGASGPTAIHEWIMDLSPAQLKWFKCRRRGRGQHDRPSITCLRDILLKVDPAELDRAITQWRIDHGWEDDAIAIDGKTMRSAINEDGRQIHVLGAIGHQTKAHYGQRTTDFETDDGEAKYTNEIGIAIPLLASIPDIAGKTVTADAMLTQTKIAEWLVDHGAYYLFIAKDNQKTLASDIKLLFDEFPDATPDYVEKDTKPKHGRKMTRKIWISDELKDVLSFPHAHQVFKIERIRYEYRKGVLISVTTEVVYGVTNHSPETADAKRLLRLNRSHWAIENQCHYYLDHADNWNEDKRRMRTGHGPANMTCLRRFAISLIKIRNLEVAKTLRNLARNADRVLAWLNLTEQPGPAPA